MDKDKNGPIHFYTSYERESYIEKVVEYVVQVGERQPLNGTQAGYLVGRGEVMVDSQRVKPGTKIPHGAWQISIRGKNHHVVIHGTVTE